MGGKQHQIQFLKLPVFEQPRNSCKNLSHLQMTDNDCKLTISFFCLIFLSHLLFINTIDRKYRSED